MSEKSKDEQILDSIQNQTFTPKSYQHALSVYLQGWNPNGSRKPFARISSWGPPGVGKTEMHEQLAKRWMRRTCTLHLSQKNPVDLQGIPIRVNNKVKWEVTSYFPQQRIFKQSNTLETYSNFDFEYAEYIIVRIEDKHGNEVAVFGDGQRYDLGLSDLNTINAKVVISDDLDSVTVDLQNSPKDRYKVFIEDACIMFADDLSAATKSVQKAALQLINDYRVGEYDLPKSCPLAAASNRESDGAFIERMNAAVANRLIHITVVPNLEDFIEYLIERNAKKHDVHEHFMSFFMGLTTDPNGLQLLSDYNPGTMKDGRLGFQTPRSWVRAIEQYNSVYEADRVYRAQNFGENNKQVAKFNTTLPMINGAVGATAARAFSIHVALYEEMPDPMDYLTGRLTELPDGKENDPGFQSRFGLKMAVAFSKLKDMYAKYDVDGDPMSLADQPEQFRVAAENFAKFSNTCLRREIAAQVGKVLARVYGVTPHYFHNDQGNSPAIDQFIKGNSKLLQRVYSINRK